MTEINWLKSVREPKYWLLAIGVGLIALHLTLTSRTNTVDLNNLMLLFWGIVAFFIWEKRDQITLESGIFSSFFGATLIALILLKSASIAGYDIFLRLSPFLSALSLGILASGFKGLKQYWKELFLLAYIAIPSGALLFLIDLQKITAQLAAFILHYCGFEVIRQGVFLVLPTGRVEVYHGCSGSQIIHQLVGLAIIFLMMFPTTFSQKIQVLTVAVSAAFFVNAARVALMAAIVSNKEVFDYWHFGQGSLIFSVIAVGIFGLFCWFAILRDEPKKEDAQKC